MVMGFLADERGKLPELGILFLVKRGGGGKKIGNKRTRSSYIRPQDEWLPYNIEYIIWVFGSVCLDGAVETFFPDIAPRTDCVTVEFDLELDPLWRGYHFHFIGDHVPRLEVFLWKRRGAGNHFRKDQFPSSFVLVSILWWLGQSDMHGKVLPQFL